MGKAGWYPDPSGGPGRRYFDGEDWGPPAPADKPARFTIHYGFGLLAVFSLLGTLIPGILMISSNAGTSSEGAGMFMGTGWLLWGGMWTLIWAAFAVQHTLRGRRR